jgi:hypothetical protein
LTGDLVIFGVGGFLFDHFGFLWFGAILFYLLLFADFFIV